MTGISVLGGYTAITPILTATIANHATQGFAVTTATDVSGTSFAVYAGGSVQTATIP